MGADVGVGEEVVEEVPEELADDAADDGREVEERGVRVVEEVGRRADELRHGGHDADGPGEEHEDEETCFSQISPKFQSELKCESGGREGLHGRRSCGLIPTEIRCFDTVTRLDWPFDLHPAIPMRREIFEAPAVGLTPF